MALGRPTEQSATLWNYNSELAADDGNEELESCQINFLEVIGTMAGYDW